MSSTEVVCIFTSTRALEHAALYDTWAREMDSLVRTTPGYLRHTSVRDTETRRGITVSYFDSEESLVLWRNNARHLDAQNLGRECFYDDYCVEIATVTRSYRWSNS